MTRSASERDDNDRYSREWRVNARLQVSWDIINPSRVPQIAAARDRYEQARDSYLIALRDLRLDTSTDYFNLQEADEGVRIGQASVRASLVSLRDARARFNAGVNTKLEVLEAETQLARDRNILTSKLGDQDTSRRHIGFEVGFAPRHHSNSRHTQRGPSVAGSPHCKKVSLQPSTSEKSSTVCFWIFRSITAKPTLLLLLFSRFSAS